VISFNERYAKAAGLLPTFLDEGDPRPAQVQIHEAYAHGGGWNKFEGFDVNVDLEDPEDSLLLYPDDPPVRAVAYCRFRDELITLFEHSWCAITQLDGTSEVARLD
jgi:hypothetical protein